MEEKEELLKLLQKAAGNLKTTRQELSSVQNQLIEPIAVIGMGCRFPGGAINPEKFWEVLSNGKNAIREIPNNRWEVDAYYDPNPDAPEKMYVRSGGFLAEPVDGFDAQFFGISPREVEYMDPQQRIVLEVVWEALEDAGINPKGLKETLTAVFIGVSNHDYNTLLTQNSIESTYNAYVASGNAYSVVAGRISYVFGLQGPSVAIDTACSSSLVALHEACQSLRDKESSLAIAGGVNLLLSPDMFIYCCKAHMLSPDGMCKTFDASADGYARGEGCGIVILKRLSDALNDGDRILALIRGSGVNQDGSSTGLTVPNQLAQADLFHSVLNRFGIKPNEVSYIEAHGTGTPLGDPIEIQSVGEVFKEGRTPENALWISTVKTNIGHLESAAGMSSLIKVILMLNHEQIPPHLHLTHLNPHINLDEIPARIPLELTSWPRGQKSRMVGINSFGFGGTNAHAIVEEGPKKKLTVVRIRRPLHLFTLSARTIQALNDLIKAYILFLENHSEVDIHDLTYTVNSGRAHFEYRLAIITKDIEELKASLANSNSQIQAIPILPPKVIFYFPNEKELRIDSILALYDTHSEFKTLIDRCAELFKWNSQMDSMKESIVQHYHSGELEVRRQLVFSYEYALMEVWKAWGIQPSAVAGNGVGVLVAAVCAGFITLEDASSVVLAGQNTQAVRDKLNHISFHPQKLTFLNSQTGESDTFTAEYYLNTFKAGLSSTPLNQPEDTHILNISFDCEWKSLLNELSRLYLKGINPNWINLNSPYTKQKIALPAYPFQRTRYWAKELGIEQAKTRSTIFSKHGLLTHKITTPLATIFESEISFSSPDFIKDHSIYDLPVLAGANYISILLTIASSFLHNERSDLVDIEILRPLILQKGEKRIFQTIVFPFEEGKHRVEFQSCLITSETQSDWIKHAEAWISIETGDIPSQPIESIINRCPKTYNGNDVRQHTQHLKLNLGPHFIWLKKLSVGDGEAIGILRYPEGNEVDYQPAYPGMIDGCFQAFGARQLLRNERDYLYIPFSVKRVSYNAQNGIPVYVHIQYLPGEYNANFTLYNAEGKAIGFINSLESKKVTKELLYKNIQPASKIRDLFYTEDWRHEPLSALSQRLSANILLLGDENNLTAELKAKFTSLGCSCVHLSKEPAADDLEDIDVVIFLNIQANEGIKTGEEQTRYLFNLTKLLANTSLLKFPTLWIITAGAQQVEPKDPINLGQSLLSGFIKTAALEMPELQFYQLDLDPTMILDMQVEQIVTELASEEKKELVAYRSNGRYVARLKRVPIKNFDELVQLDTKAKGPLSNLYLKPLERPPTLEPHDIVIQVKAAGLNFRDVLNAMGLYPGEATPLGECSGIITAIGDQVNKFNVGDEVLGFGGNCFANYTVSQEKLLVLKPAELSFINAAAIPTVFSTAYYALYHLCHLQPGERVLIHAGAGGVGLAAIQIAQMLGAEIYATAGSELKQEYLRQLGIKYVYHSRNLDYADQILVDTKGHGVDVVLNSLSGEGFVENTLKACHPNARFVEIGKRNIWSEEEVKKAKPDLSYYILALDDEIEHNPDEVKKLLEELMHLFSQNKLKPIPCATFNLKDAEAAFQYLRHAKQIGKVVILPHQPLQINKEGSYLITGGLGGLGLKVAEWLSAQGATHIILTGRRQPVSEIPEVEHIEKAGTHIEIVSCDVSKETEVEKLIQRFNSEWPQLKGIIHAAGILNDGSIMSLEWPAFESVYAPKVWGSWYLHQATKDKPLDFFIMFSSAASVLGAPGQSNYASANSFLDALAAYRQTMGLPALAISWGSWSEVGMAANLVARHFEQGIIAMSPKEGLEALKMAVNQPLPHLMIASIDWQKLKTKEKSSFFIELKQQRQKQVKIEILETLKTTSGDLRVDALKGYLKDVVREVLGIAEQKISDDLPITELGMDSLMAIEIRNKLQNDLGGKFPASFALTYPTIQLLSDEILKQLNFEKSKEINIENTIEFQEPAEEKVKPWQPLTEWTDLPERQITVWALLPFSSTPYITAGCYLNNLKLDVFREAYSNILQKYPLLSMKVNGWRPKYRIPEITLPTIFVTDLTNLPPEAQREQILEKMREYLRIKDTWKYISFALVFKLSESNFFLRLFLTHLFDGNSLNKIFHDLLTFYGDLVSGRSLDYIQEIDYFSVQNSLRGVSEGVNRKIAKLEAFWKGKTAFYSIPNKLVDLEQNHCISEKLRLDAENTKLLYIKCAKQKINIIHLIGLFANFAFNLLANQTETAYQIVYSLRKASDTGLGLLATTMYYSIKQNDQMSMNDFVNALTDSSNILDLADYPFEFAYPKMEKASSWSKLKVRTYFNLMLPSNPWKKYFVEYISQLGGSLDYLDKTRTTTMPLTLTINPYIYDIENPEDPLVMTSHYFARNVKEKIWASHILILKAAGSLDLHYEGILKPEVQRCLLYIVEDLIKTFVASDTSQITLGDIKSKWTTKITDLTSVGTREKT